MYKSQILRKGEQSMTVEQVVRYTELARRRSELSPANVEHDAEIAEITAELKELRKVIDAEHARRAGR